jgi:serine protease Do
LREALAIGPGRGAVIEDVQEQGPAARAGLRQYDVVVAIDGRDIENDEELVRFAAGLPPGRSVKLSVWRAGRVDEVVLKLGVRAATLAARRFTGSTDARPAAQDQAPLGLKVRDLDSDLADRLGLPNSVRGVLVTEVDPAGPAQLAELRTNHVITEINRTPVRSEADFRRLVGGLRSGAAVALLVYDRASRQYRLSTIVSEPAK